MTNDKIDIKFILKTVILPFMLMLAVWFCKEFFLDNIITSQLNPLSSEIVTSLIKLVLWCGASLLLINYFKQHLFVSLSDMFKNKFDFKLFLIVFALFSVYILLGAYSNFGYIRINENFKLPSLISKFIVVGITEELFFRGYLLNVSLTKIKNQNVAIGLNSLLFLIIHFPIWITNGVFISNFTSFAFLTVIILNIIFCYCFIKGKNLLIPVLLHMYWDLMVTVLYG